MKVVSINFKAQTIKIFLYRKNFNQHLFLKYEHFSHAQVKKDAVSFCVVIVNCLPDIYRLSDCIPEGFLSVKKDNYTGWLFNALSFQKNMQVVSVTMPS
jgi:hypothetical protein